MKNTSPPVGIPWRIALTTVILLLSTGIGLAAPPVTIQPTQPAQPAHSSAHASTVFPEKQNPQASPHTAPTVSPPSNPSINSSPTAGPPVNDPLRVLIIPAGSEPILMGVSAHPERLIPGYWRQYPTGLYNAITDVPGIQVGHVSLYRDRPARIRTGVTAIVPDAVTLTGGQGNLANTGFRASAVMLNGNGELTGMGPLQTAGILNSPIILTNTDAVGTAHQGVFEYFSRQIPGQWEGQLPVVGECWDGFFNTIEEPILASEDTTIAIESARGGAVPQGRVGAGTGMRSFELHAGIGSSSRKVVINDRTYTIGVLVNTNHSKLALLNPTLRAALEKSWGMSVEHMKAVDDADQAIRQQKPESHPESRQGSIIVVIATDLPLDAKALQTIAQRAALGIGNTGSVMATTSGDFAIAFSTASPVPLGKQAPALLSLSSIHPDALTPILQATVEAVTEAQLNALVASHTTRVSQYGP